MSTPLDHIDCVLLDRDGVINFDSEDYIKHPDEWQPIPGALDAIARLQQYLPVAVCTNQSGIGRELFDLATLEAIHEKFLLALAAHGGKPLSILFCPHRPDDDCPCRKPKAGLLTDALSLLKREPRHTAFVGDSARDLQAAQTIGALPILVLTGNGATTAERDPNRSHVFDNLASFTDALLKQKVETTDRTRAR